MLKDISIHRPIWMGFDDLKHIVVPANTAYTGDVYRAKLHAATPWIPEAARLYGCTGLGVLSAAYDGVDCRVKMRP